MLLGLLIEYLDAPDAEVASARLAEASLLATEHGRQLAALGASMTEAVQTFIRFRMPFTNALAATARQRGLDTREATTMLVAAETALDQLLVATIAGYSEASPEPASPAGPVSARSKPLPRTGPHRSS